MCEVSGETLGNVYLYLQDTVFPRKRRRARGGSSYDTFLKNQHKIASVYVAPHFIENTMSVLGSASVFGLSTKFMITTCSW